MNITGVTTAEAYRCIPIKGLDSVEHALNVFAGGMTRGSRATEQHQTQAIGESQGGIAQAFYLLAAPHMRGAGNEFVRERIMNEARPALQRRPEWSRHFDYDGMGVFFKTSVDIRVLSREDDLYGLGIHSAYVGDEPEKGLAEHLGIPRALAWVSVDIETTPIEGNRFEFDFEAVLRKLDRRLRKGVSGKQVAGYIVSAKLTDESPFILYRDRDVRVSLGLSTGTAIGRRDFRVLDDEGRPLDTWEAEGSILRGGLLWRSYGGVETLTSALTISLSSAQSNEYGSSLPVWDPEKKKRILDLRDRIASAMRS